MSIFDLLLIAVFLCTVFVILTILALLLQRRFGSAFRLFKLWGLAIAAYFIVLLGVASVSPQRIVNVGEDLCSDDWCLGVDGVSYTHELGTGETAATAKGVFYVVKIRISNRGLGRPQRENGVFVYLRDGQGRRYDPSPEGQRAFEVQNGPALPLTSIVEVRQPVETVRVFDLPRGAQDVGLIIGHEGISPDWFVIGSDGSLLHRTTVIRLSGLRN